ncbi:MAG: MGMT family protein [Propionicimonas sp.]|uniref:MGMT family protein n=1 Tax=Propionicimonas sp. TaxID=1955623 RepID=UPI002B220B7A|nr:MGMT family protein [Propionicimonas sp.]MEA4942810.1 MGMT family protein [Propionicimonas sp.]
MGVITAVTDSVLLAVASVPPGRVTSYGAIGRLVGAGPRVVARVLAGRGDEVCWWRVIRADGTIAPQVVERASVLLAEEGVVVRDGRVDLRQYGA